MIKIVGLHKTYGSNIVLCDVNMELPGGKIVGLYGNSGCGKTTIAKILCGVEKPTFGEVYCDGNLLASSKKRMTKQEHNLVQMVYQQPFASLDPVQKIGHGIEELIAYYKLAPRKKRRHVAEQTIKRMGLVPEVLDAFPSAISGGEAQRISLAKCMLLKPKLLILDEATSMLDVSTQANVLGLVKDLVDETSMSVLLISHDKELVEYYCDEIYGFYNKKYKKLK